MRTPEISKPNPEKKESRLGIQNREALRIIPIQMVSTDDIMAQLLPRAESLTNATLPPAHIQLSVTVLEAKNSQSLHPNDITVPGGKFELSTQPDADSPNDQATQRAEQIIWNELHLNPTSTVLLPLERIVDVRNLKLFGKHKPGVLHTQEHWLVVVASPHDRQINVFSPRYQIKEAIRLKPDDLSAFLTTEQRQLKDGTTGYLLDSLSRDPTRRLNNHVEATYPTGQSDETFRYAIEVEAYKYEAAVLSEVVMKFMVLSSINPPSKLLSTLYKNIVENPQPTTLVSAKQTVLACREFLRIAETNYDNGSYQQIHPNTFIPKETIDAYRKHGISPEIIKRRALFLEEFLHAFNQVTLQQTLELTGKTGPQQPYILAQIIPSLCRMTDVEYNILSRNAWIKHLIDVPLEVFHIDPSKPNWHKKLLAKLKEIQLWENDANPQRRTAYKQYAQAIDASFCNPTSPAVPKIGKSTNLGHRSENANAYTEHLKNTIAPVSTPEVRWAISTNPFGSDTHNTLELIYRMWGLNQYDTTRGELPKSEQTAAWIKLLHELLDQQISEMWETATNVSVKPMRDAFDKMFGGTVGEFVTENMPYPKYVMDEKIRKNLSLLAHPKLIPIQNGKNVDLSSFNISVVANIRVKNMIELKRKWLERGSLKNDGSIDLTDFFGFFIALDDKLFLQELYERCPSLTHASQTHTTEAILAQWKRFAATVILRGMEQIVTNQTPRRLTIWHDKARVTTKILDGIIDSEPQKAGSAASRDICQWLKYVLHVSDGTQTKEVEIQFFPSFTELGTKLQDDEWFHILRLFQKPTNRYPTIELEFGNQEGFEEMLRLQMKARDNERKCPQWKMRLATMLLHAYDRLTSQQSVIYEHHD